MATKDGTRRRFARQSRKGPPEAAPEEGQPQPRVKILMVDDTPENLIALEAVLEKLGQQIVKAHSGEEALRLLLKEDFAVILLDVNMPGLNGFETAEMIRQRKSSEHTPIIFVSAISTSDSHMFKGYSLGAVDYIFTPVIPDVLRSKVAVFVELLKKTEQAKEQAEQIRAIEERDHRRKLNEASRRIALQTQQNRFFTLSVDLLAIVGQDGFIKELNPAWSRALGYAESQLKKWPFWEWIPGEERLQMIGRLQQASREEAATSIETRFLCEDGSHRWISWTIAPYGAEQLLYIFGRDMTERRASEEQIRKLNSDLAARADDLLRANAELEGEVQTRKRAEQALQDSNSALETFSYSVSHDLRAPLRAMQGFARVLLEDCSENLGDLGVDYATRIVTAAERMDTLIQDLLVYSRLEHAELQLSNLELNELVADVAREVDPELQQRKAELIVHQPLPMVRAHSVTLTQVLVNLVTNAVKFVPPDVRPRVEIKVRQEDGHAVLAVQDNGIGIDPKDQARIFRVFERLNTAELYPGTGLGLAIVRKGVERMGGQVGVDSVPGKGSCFWIRLPLS